MGVQTNSDRGMDVDMYIGGRQITCFNDIQGYHLIRDRFGLRDDFLDDTFSWDDFDRRAGVLCQKSYSLCGLYVVQRLTVSEHETMKQLGPLFCEHYLKGGSLLCPIVLHFQVTDAQDVSYIVSSSPRPVLNEWDAIYDFQGTSGIDRVIHWRGR